ncbi:NucA/NucB deoxyribonuclease domain-containing protein [Thermomonospora umbrina]|uniref:Deoxyribonuclease NucA/NucB n=1 Tax=Thermomonospora umbrina TaxID=111806 RepID=A0A3D9T6K8_9ACTN|nr:NucA/NucB deoxyribonuclease domain-containing protein [Thermomonospora umbrina]REF00295.1 deoxyribonuclease NucA/NucB [Thermomonospora umbrina]
MLRQKWRAFAAMLALLGGMLVSASSAAVAQDNSSRIKVSVTSLPEVSAPDCHYVTRTQWCETRRFVGSVYLNGKKVGEIYQTLIQRIIFDVKSLKFTERVSLRTDNVIGKHAQGVRAYMSVGCGKWCNVVNNLPKNVLVKKGTIYRGKASYSIKVAPKVIRYLRNSYSLRFTKPGYKPAVVPWKGEPYRCDDRFGKRQRPGCVHHRTFPVITTFKDLKFIAPGIRRIQQKGPKHYGRRRDGLPLHYMASKTRAENHRTAVCRGQKPPAKLPSGWPTGQPPSCDEYPLAHTLEGGTNLPAAERGITWVPLSENHAQGGRFNAFLVKNRVLDGDAFWVAV